MAANIIQFVAIDLNNNDKKYARTIENMDDRGINKNSRVVRGTIFSFYTENANKKTNFTKHHYIRNIFDNHNHSEIG